MLEKQSPVYSSRLLFLAVNTACHEGMDRVYWNEQAGQAYRGPEASVS